MLAIAYLHIHQKQRKKHGQPIKEPFTGRLLNVSQTVSQIINYVLFQAWANVILLILLHDFSLNQLFAYLQLHLSI